MTLRPSASRFEDPGIAPLFEQDSRWQSWLDVEAALAQAQAELGMIPADAANTISQKADLANLDREAIAEGLVRTAHPLVPLVWSYSSLR